MEWDGNLLISIMIILIGKTLLIPIVLMIIPEQVKVILFMVKIHLKSKVQCKRHKKWIKDKRVIQRKRNNW